jgi:FkbM family methyltransferase
VAFEPSPYAYARLKAILQENGISQVRALQCAAGDEDRTQDLYLPSEDYLHSPSLVQSDKSYTPVEVKVCRLDSHPALAQLPIVDMMKIDVEGFEPNALRGMSEYLRAGRVRYLMCEFNSGWLEANGSSCDALLTMIRDLDFVVHKETPRATVTAPSGLVYQYQDILFQFRAKQ